MTDFRNVKPEMYCTPMDVRQLIEVLQREAQDDDDGLKRVQDITDQRIELHITNAVGLIDTYLLPVYAAADLAKSAWFRGPVPAAKNTTSAYLSGIVLGSGNVTEQWLIRFTALGAYTVVGSVSGVQTATGTTATDYTSDNGDIQILAADWMDVNSEGIGAGNEFMVSTFVVKPVIAHLASQLAASELIDAVASDTESDATSWGRSLHKKAMSVLRDLADDDKPASLTTNNDDDIINPAVSFTIDDYGRDQSKYITGIDGDVNPFD